MIKCQACGNGNQDNSQYCDECGSRLESDQRKYTRQIESPKFQQLISESQLYQPTKVVSFSSQPLAEKSSKPKNLFENKQKPKTVYGKLVIERGNTAGTEFKLTAEESYLGRWDADNGIFPDVDLDKHDTDAKVSRRHARITCKDGKFAIEDLGSTNGTYINRGRRLIPGSLNALNSGDEIIVGKTFLRFYIEN